VQDCTVTLFVQPIAACAGEGEYCIENIENPWGETQYLMNSLYLN